MKIHFYASLFFSLLGAFSTLAQDYYRPGKIFTAEGDTLSGQINSQQTARYIKFKSAGQAVSEYNPAQLKGYWYEGNRYESLRIETKDVVVYSQGVEPLFLQVLVDGRARLYYFQEQNTEEHYWVRKDTMQYELRMIRKEIQKNNWDRYMLVVKEYQGIMEALFKDCPKLKPAQYNFTRNDLVAAVTAYNACFEGPKPQVTRTRGKLRLHPGVKGGYSYFTKANAQGGYGPSVGAFVNLPFTGANRVVSAQFEVVHNQYNFTSGGYSYRLNLLDLAAYLRYTAPKGWVRPYVAIGLARGAGKVTAQNTQTASSEETGRLLMVKALGEAGIQVPVKKHFLYAGLHYGFVPAIGKDRYKIINLSVALAL